MTISTESVECVLCANGGEATARGKGGFFYEWSDDRKRFPDDVKAVIIVMPVTWGDVNENAEDYSGHGVLIGWDVPRWTLTGTPEKPTLNPSLNWVNVWHGWLRDGRLVSC